MEIKMTLNGNGDHKGPPLDGSDNIKIEQKIIEEQIRLGGDRNKIERNKYWVGIISIITSITLAFIAYFHHLSAQEHRAHVDFEIKAMEIVMNDSDPRAMYNKSILMTKLFPTRVPKDLPEKIAELYNISIERPNIRN
jgi:hypothetical protein